MSAVLEIVRFTIKPEAEAQFLAERPQVIKEFRARFPGLIAAQLVKLENGEYLDAVRWACRDQALAASAGAPNVPVIALWFGHIDQVLSIEHADVRHLSETHE